MALTEPIRELMKRVEAAEAVRKTSLPGEQMLEVNRLIARAASFYEKVRYLIDYREEHTIRRAAIERILKRRVFLEQRTQTGSILLQELVDGQYLDGAQATEEMAADIDQIVWKFLMLLDRAKGNGTVARALMSFAATEIDAHLTPLQYAVDDAAVDAFYKTLKGRVSVSGVSDEVANAQLYCACWRSLLVADNERLSYALWLVYAPEWKQSADFGALAPKLSQILAQIRATAGDHLQWQLAPKIKNESIYFHIIRDIVQNNGAAAEHILISPEELDHYTRAFLAKKYERENERIQSSGVRAVFYLFLTKILVALLVEAPYEYFFLGAIHYVPLTVNAFFHPFLLFMLTRRVGALDESNTQAILTGIHSILYEGKVRAIRIRNTSTHLTLIFGTLYLALVMLVFGALIGLLQMFGFNPVSIVLFLFFLALVSYFAFRIRYQARRWKIVERQGGFALLVSILATPVIRTGRWLSRTFSSINIFVIILDFIIETPFKRLLNFSNQFLYYLREKAEEMR